MRVPSAFVLILLAFGFAVIALPHVWSQELLDDWQMSEYDKVHILLSETSTMSRLAITPAQQAALLAVHDIEWQTIPVVSNLLARSKAANESDRRSLLCDADRAASEYKLNQVAVVLYPEQWRALQSILLREKGLSVVLSSEPVRAQLGVTKDQLERMRLGAARYDPLLDGLNQRLGRQKVAGLRPDEDISGREQEVDCIERVMQALTADKNRDIRAVLTEDQRNRWDLLVGEDAGSVARLHEAVTNVPTESSVR